MAVWLKNRFGLGNWVLFVGIGLGVVSAIDGFYKSLKALENLTKEKKKDKPPISFSEHD